MDWHSPEQVAALLDLHVRTVRGYIRDGRLPAVKVGKQYRIAGADLDAFLGRPSREPSVEVTAVIEVDDVDRDLADRLSTLVVAGAQGTPTLRVQAVWDSGREHLKLIAIGDLAATASVLATVQGYLGARTEES